MAESGSQSEFQRLVDFHFTSAAQEWREMYEREDLLGVIHQYRAEVTLAWIERLDLPPGASVLEIGCGAGVGAVALARRGFEVDATDNAHAMVDMTRQLARKNGLETRLHASVADTHALPFAPETFELVVALGVVSFLHSPRVALREMVRVLKPGGYLLVHAGNRLRLNYLLDPLFTPPLSPLRRVVRTGLQRLGLRWPPSFLREAEARGGPAPGLHSRREFDRLVDEAGINRVDACTLGFGPFTLFGVAVVPRGLDVRLHRALQRLADRGTRGIRGTGMQYLVLARKPAAVRPASALLAHPDRDEAGPRPNGRLSRDPTLWLETPTTTRTACVTLSQARRLVTTSRP